MRRQLRATHAGCISKTKTPQPDEITGAQLDQFFQDVSKNEKFLHGEWARTVNFHRRESNPYQRRGSLHRK